MITSGGVEGIEKDVSLGLYNILAPGMELIAACGKRAERRGRGKEPPTIYHSLMTEMIRDTTGWEGVTYTVILHSDRDLDGRAA